VGGARLFSERLAGEPVAGLDALLGEPALIHLQHEANRLVGAVRIGGERLHVGQRDDGAVVRHERGRERQQCVHHPETLDRGLLELEQHAFVLRHLLAEHEADLPLLGGRGDLGIDLVHAC
jgi:hypothetical protein